MSAYTLVNVRQGATNLNVAPGPSLKLATALTGPQGPRWTRSADVIDFNPTMTVDLNGRDIADITLTGDATLQFTGGVDGQSITLRLKQDDTGGRLVAWGTNVRFGTDVPWVELSSVPGKTDYVAFIYHAADGTYDLVSFVRGF